MPPTIRNDQQADPTISEEIIRVFRAYTQNGNVSSLEYVSAVETLVCLYGRTETSGASNMPTVERTDELIAKLRPLTQQEIWEGYIPLTRESVAQALNAPSSIRPTYTCLYSNGRTNHSREPRLWLETLTDGTPIIGFRRKGDWHDGPIPEYKIGDYVTFHHQGSDYYPAKTVRRIHGIHTNYADFPNFPGGKVVYFDLGDGIDSTTPAVILSRSVWNVRPSTPAEIKQHKQLYSDGFHHRYTRFSTHIRPENMDVYVEVVFQENGKRLIGLLAKELDWDTDGSGFICAYREMEALAPDSIELDRREQLLAALEEPFTRDEPPPRRPSRPPREYVEAQRRREVEGPQENPRTDALRSVFVRDEHPIGVSNADPIPEPVIQRLTGLNLTQNAIITYLSHLRLDGITSEATGELNSINPFWVGAISGLIERIAIRYVAIVGTHEANNTPYAPVDAFWSAFISGLGTFDLTVRQFPFTMGVHRMRRLVSLVNSHLGDDVSIRVPTDIFMDRS